MVVANEIMNAFDKDDPSSIKKCRQMAKKVFGEGWEEKGSGIYDEGPKKVNVWGIGQYVFHSSFIQWLRVVFGSCHIDTAWLWPYRVTQQKVARSWSTQIDLIQRYPEHRFASSSAQQYKWLEELYPSLFESLKE
jgi:alpha-mannosidase